MLREVKPIPAVWFERKEDMTPKGSLSVTMQNNGDWLVQVTDDGGMSAGIGFTMPMIGGGASPRTFEAIKQLAIAIALDNAESPGRKGRIDSSEQCVKEAVSKYPAALNKNDIANFETIQHAGMMGDLALLSAVRKADNKPVALVTAIGFHDGEYVLSPLAVMIEGNPYEDFTPPSEVDPELRKTEVKPKRRKKK